MYGIGFTGVTKLLLSIGATGMAVLFVSFGIWAFIDYHNSWKQLDKNDSEYNVWSLVVAVLALIVLTTLAYVGLLWIYFGDTK